MKVAVMQPYFFPYIGYFQLIKMVDKFVFLDNVNYINKGWINRNKILAHGKSHDFVVPLKGASQNKKINEILVDSESKLLKKFTSTILNSYKNHPNFKPVSHLIEKSLFETGGSLADMAIQSIVCTTRYLGIDCEFINSSDLDIDSRGEERIIDICVKLGASEYFNLPGGAGLYNQENFLHRNIKLDFIVPRLLQYNQKSREFVSGLSIIDMLMCETPVDVRERLL